ncbi:MAG TPA: hydroxyacid dehydrogenase [Bacilli bacterium]|nr:hydroxyacid dehydrogenase [Bacilli bacterium]
MTDPLAEDGLEVLRQTPGVDVDVRTGLSPAEFFAAIDAYDALLVRSQTQVTAEVLAAGRRLRAVGRAGVGVDNVDVTAATQRGVVVFNAPDGNTLAACEHTFALLLAVARSIPQAHERLREGVWDRTAFVGVELFGKTLGMVGFGRIGREVAKRALAFGMRVVAFTPSLTPETALAQVDGVTCGSLEEVLATADFLTLHAPLTDDTRHLLSRERLRHLKRGVRIVNCARGGLIDEEALAEALREGHVAAAALDVFEEEPLRESPLRGLSNCILTPHLGASTQEAQRRVAVDVANELLRFFQGRPVKNAVNPEVLSGNDQG